MSAPWWVFLMIPQSLVGFMVEQNHDCHSVDVYRVRGNIRYETKHRTFEETPFRYQPGQPGESFIRCHYDNQGTITIQPMELLPAADMPAQRVRVVAKHKNKEKVVSSIVTDREQLAEAVQDYLQSWSTNENSKDRE